MHHPHRRPRIAVAGLATESSTFGSAVTTAEAFSARRGDDVLELYDFLAPGSPLREAADWHGALRGRALPGGPVPLADYLALADEIASRLAALAPLDGVLVDLHGAMSVLAPPGGPALDDVEADLVARIRAAVGPDAILSASMDLHGNVSRELVHRLDLITCYRLAPHEDEGDTRERAARTLVEHLASGRPRPLKAWVPIPVLLPGEKTSTRIEPARSVYARVAEVEGRDGIVDAALWVGYAWADEPRNRAAAVVTGSDERAVREGAQELASGFWAARDDFAFVAPTDTLDGALDRALASPARPFLVSDSGDNPTAGGDGDSSWGLGRVLARAELSGADGGPTVIYASVPAPEAVEACVAAGVGGVVSGVAGVPALAFRGVVHSIHAGDPHAETEVVVRMGSVFAILTAKRKPYHHLADFTALDLDPAAADVIVVKIGYLEPELFDLAADWILALTPGAVDQDLERLGHRRLRRPMHPFDAFPEAGPDLAARLIPASDQPLTGDDE